MRDANGDFRLSPDLLDHRTVCKYGTCASSDYHKRLQRAFEHGSNGGKREMGKPLNSLARCSADFYQHDAQ